MYVFGSLGFLTMARLRYAAKFDPFLSRVEGIGAQSKDQILPSGNIPSDSEASYQFNSLISFAANCVVMALDEHLPNGDKTLLALQLVSTDNKREQFNLRPPRTNKGLRSGRNR